MSMNNAKNTIEAIAHTITVENIPTECKVITPNAEDIMKALFTQGTPKVPGQICNAVSPQSTCQQRLSHLLKGKLITALRDTRIFPIGLGDGKKGKCLCKILPACPNSQG